MGGYNTIRYFESKKDHMHIILMTVIILIIVVKIVLLVIVVIILLCLINKLNFILGRYV